MVPVTLEPDVCEIECHPKGAASVKTQYVWLINPVSRLILHHISLIHMQQVQERNPDIPLPSKMFQHVLGDSKVTHARV